MLNYSVVTIGLHVLSMLNSNQLIACVSPVGVVQKEIESMCGDMQQSRLLQAGSHYVWDQIPS